MTVLRRSQIEDLQEVQTICKQQGADVVIIGAVAYRLFVDDADRETRDIDLAVALDLVDMLPFQKLLQGLGWQRDLRNEQRWQTRRGGWIDLLPAGPALRSQGKLVWPESGHVMSLAGFGHVFADSVFTELAPGFELKVVPPAVLALVKMGSYLDDPYGRAKDLADIRRLLRNYAMGSPRVFLDDVFRAELPDIEFADAFLLGLDMRALATEDDIALVESFLREVNPLIEAAPPLDFEGRDAERLKQQLSAFEKGFYSR
jgi:predicted nucleotidyltransferase